MLKVLAYIGLGSNLDFPDTQLRRALSALADLPDSQLLAQSSFYRSRPMGPQDQADFINAVAAIQTGLEPGQLLQRLQAIESDQGRVRRRHWGPRSIDLDILLFGQLIIDHSELKIPHPGLCERNFVLYPLYEIASELILPDGRPLQQVVEACPMDGLIKI